MIGCYRESVVTITNSEITNNIASINGGGVYVNYPNDVTVTSNAISHNIAEDGSGAAIWVGNSNSVISTNTIINNLAEGNPTGGIYIDSASNPTITNNDIYGNTGSGGNYDIYNANNNTADDIDATNNFSNTSSLSEIESRIYHGIDDASLGLINYQPFSSSPVGTGPTPGPTITPTPTGTPTGTDPDATPTPQPTATVTPVTPDWLVLLYLAGDDQDPDRPAAASLSEPLASLLPRLRSMPYNPQIRLVILYDGANTSDSRIYVRELQELRDVTEQAAASSLWFGGMGGSPGARELDTGSALTLRNFVTWAHDSYAQPTRTFLSEPI